MKKLNVVKDNFRDRASTTGQFIHMRVEISESEVTRWLDPKKIATEVHSDMKLFKRLRDKK